MAVFPVEKFNGGGGQCPMCGHLRCLRPSCATGIRYREALEKIASEDYRGNRSTASGIAYRALHPEEGA